MKPLSLSIEKIWQNYSLSIVLMGLFSLSLLGQLIFQWQEYVETASSHQQAVQIASFVPEFLAAVFENWQSEFLQLFAMVVLTSFLIHKGSPESKDSDDQMQRTLDRIEQAVKKAP